nr:hypothetical protein CFP56_06902 [Quercus suber]
MALGFFSNIQNLWPSSLLKYDDLRLSDDLLGAWEPPVSQSAARYGVTLLCHRQIPYPPPYIFKVFVCNWSDLKKENPRTQRIRRSYHSSILAMLKINKSGGLGSKNFLLGDLNLK